MGEKKKDPDSTLPGRSFGHVDLEFGEPSPSSPGPVRRRSEEATQGCEHTRAAVGDPRVAAMRELYAEGDANGALFIALSIAPEAAPDAPLPDQTLVKVHVDDRTITHDSSKQLAVFTSDRGIPLVRKSPEEIAALPIDHRGGFLLAHIDGIHTMEEILDVCAMPEAEAVFLIRQLVAMGVVEFRAREDREDTPPSSSRRGRVTADR
ncbi:MAG: hypothetical protein K0S65_5367 [Labilithrix sp.]|nr:hypothetical protein [Labilithrix sp.]